MPDEENIIEHPEAGDEPQTTITMKGKTSKVKKSMKELGGQQPQSQTDEDTEENLGDLLLNPRFQILAERTSPTEIDGQELQNQVEFKTPTNIMNIRRQLEKEWGGKTWFVGVYDKRGEKVGGLTFELSSPAKPKFAEETLANQGFGETPFSALNKEDEDGEDIIREQEKMLKQKARLKLLKQIAGDDDESSSKTEKMIAEMNARFEKTISDMKASHEAEVRRLNDEKKEREQLQQIANIQKQMADMQASFLKAIQDMKTEGSGSKTQDILFKTISDNQNKMFEAITKSLESKITSMGENNRNTLEMFKSMNENSGKHFSDILSMVTHKNENTFDTVGKVIETVKTLNEAMGIGGGGTSEPLDWGSRIAGMLEKAVPSVLEWLQARQKAGIQTTEEQLKAQYDKIAEDIKPMIQEQLKAIGNKKLPPPVENAKTETDVSKPEPEPAPQPTTISEGEAEMKPEEILAETKNRVNSLIKVIMRESEIRPREAQWVDLALAHLPEDVLEEVANAKNQGEIENVIKKYADPTLLMTLGLKIKMSPKKEQWLQEQFKILIEEFKASKTTPVNPNPPVELTEEEESPQI